MSEKKRMYGAAPSDPNTPKPIKEKLDYGVRKSGSVTEITLGDKTFEVMSPEKINKMYQMIQQQENALFEMRNHVKNQTKVINSLAAAVDKLTSDVNELRKNGGSYGSREVFDD